MGEDNIIAEIEQYKAQLAAIDYKANKRLRGELSDEEWEEYCATCRDLIARINELEKEL